MRLTTQEQECVDYFWHLVDEAPTYPCELERYVALALPVAIIKLPHLKIHTIESWLQKHGVPLPLGIRSRSVRGCLIAHGDHCLVFLDGTDPLDEQRFTLAHEIAHFLIDYLWPRKKAIQQLGKDIIPILDGLQQPKTADRLRALISSIPLGRHVNMLARHDEDGSMTFETLQIESKADRIALTLLAPPDEALSNIDLSSSSFTIRKTQLAHTLLEDFGLPAAVAEPYAGLLLSRIGKGPDSWLEKLRRNF